MTIILNSDDVRELLTMPDCIEALETMYIEHANGSGGYRRRSDIITPTPLREDGFYSLKSMDGVVPKLGVGAIRINSDILTFPERHGNVRRVKIPAAPNERYTAPVLLFSVETGEPLAIFPDGVLQPMRVAGTSALAAKYLAKTGANTVAIIGSGWQARAQVRAITHVLPIKNIQCYSTNKEHREKFCLEMSPVVDLEINPVTTSHAAVEGSDIVLCATSSIAKVLEPEWVEPGMHISSIRRSEIYIDVLQKCDVIVSHHEDCNPSYVFTDGVQVPGAPDDDLQNLSNLIDFSNLTNLSGLISGQSKGRTSDDQISCFLNTIGLGSQFAAVGSVLYRKAKEAGKGHEVPTDWFTQKEVP